MTWEYVQMIAPTLWSGTKTTILLFLLTLLFALPLGLPIALGRMSRIKPIKWLSSFYVWVFRGTPLMLQLFFFYFFLYQPQIGLQLDAFTTAVITFALNYAAYFAEIYRAGIEGVDRGQREAAKSLGFSPWQTMRMIVLPQATKLCLPPIGNELITLVKDTALANVISVMELLHVAKSAVNRGSNPTAYFLAAIIYLALTSILMLLMSLVEKRMSKHERKDAV